MNEKFLKPYNPQDTEKCIYDMWEQSGVFNPDVCEKEGLVDAAKEPFSMVLPPPNVTGVLHMGSSLMITIEDIIARKARMEGRKTLWIPGTDHAAIATQSVVEKKLEKEEGKRKHDLGREEFLKRVEQFASDSHDTIVTQAKSLGGSLDWSREAFTLDEKRNLAVRTAFKTMHDDGLIYRGFRVVNWDPKGQTTISDDEIVYEERDTILYTFYYGKDKDGNKFPIPISTTRLETKFGDHAVAVHPDDERYQEYVGQTFDVEFLGEPISIKVIADHSVEKDFGTGALGVTPAHSMIDAEIAQRHGLKMTQIIDEYGKLMVGPEGIKGKKSAEVRPLIAEKLKEAGLLISEEKTKQNISTAERTGGIIEPLPKLQWFINVNKETKHGKTLKEMMLNVISPNAGDKKITFVPERFENIYSKWIENLRDWCISRQIWYGHQIPVWYRGNEIYCNIDAPKDDGKGEWVQDSDTLDTWFSSGLWTFSTLGWPDVSAQDLKEFHPTTLLETGSDIIFFWVARMILMTTYLLDTIPFKTVYLHGLVRDGQGRKISKSLGNNINPIDMITKYGTDSIRMSFVIGTQPGADSKISEEKIKAYKNFANKLWNITRFVITNTEDFEGNAHEQTLEDVDQSLLKEHLDFIQEIDTEINQYHLHLAGEKAYHYVWHTFADLILEDSKLKVAEPGATKASRQAFLIIALSNILKTLHPFMPYVTEEIWQLLPQKFKQEKGDHQLLMVSRWPAINKKV